MTYPPPSPPFIAARHRGGRQTIRGIVIHGTVSSDDRGTARRIANWWAGPTSPVTSCHYVVDPGEVIQCVGDHTVAFHCGSNAGVIGVELCDEQTGPARRWQDADSQAIIRRAARLVAELCLAYDIQAKRPTVAELKSKGKHGIYGHNDSRLAFGHTTHTDPREFPWNQFLTLVRSEIEKIKNRARLAPRRRPPKVAPPTPTRPRAARLIPFFHSRNYVRHNSPVGLSDGAVRGFKSIDLDFHISRDGHWVNIHWPDMRGFRTPGGKRPTGRVKDHTWAYLSRLKSRYGNLQNAWRQIHLAKRKGYTLIEVEVKDIPTVEQFWALRGIAKHAGIRIVVKRLTSIPGWNTALRNAKVAGLDTMLLVRGDVVASKDSWGYIDYVRQGGRNKVTWA